MKWIPFTPTIGKAFLTIYRASADPFGCAGARKVRMGSSNLIYTPLKTFERCWWSRFRGRRWRFPMLHFRSTSFNSIFRLADQLKLTANNGAEHFVCCNDFALHTTFAAA